MSEACAPYWIEPPGKGQVFQSAKGPRRVVIDVIDDEIVYRTIGKSARNRITHITSWRTWCNENMAFLITTPTQPAPSTAATPAARS